MRGRPVTKEPKRPAWRDPIALLLILSIIVVYFVSEAVSGDPAVVIRNTGCWSIIVWIGTFVVNYIRGSNRPKNSSSYYFQLLSSVY